MLKLSVIFFSLVTHWEESVLSPESIAHTLVCLFENSWNQFPYVGTIIYQMTSSLYLSIMIIQNNILTCVITAKPFFFVIRAIAIVVFVANPKLGYIIVCTSTSKSTFLKFLLICIKRQDKKKKTFQWAWFSMSTKICKVRDSDKIKLGTQRIEHSVANRVFTLQRW